MDEPIIHSHHTDILGEDDPRAYGTISCDCCTALVHASNNECMTTWVEWGGGILCGECFAPLMAFGVLELTDFLALCRDAEAIRIIKDIYCP